MTENRPDDRMLGPGVTSKIVWHFTGGRKQDGTDKTDEEAFEHLSGILSSTTLEARCLEKIRHIVDADEACFVPLRPTVRVACLAEIPIQHLPWHARTYNRFAIGFYRDAVIDCGFRPVFYLLADDPLARAIFQSTDGSLAASVKNFTRAQLDTVYAEREWRYTDDYRFDWSHVVMIVLPKDYRERLLRDHRDLPRVVPLVAYEDLLQH